MKKTHPGKKANVWEPYQRPEIKTYDNGVVCMSDLSYGTMFPNSFLDIWFPDGDRNTKRPAIIYFHGGGFCMGDKSSGDPISIENQNNDMDKEHKHSNMLLEMVKRGYIIVICSGLLNSAAMYYFTYFIGDASKMSIIGIASFSSLIMLVVFVPLANKFGKCNVMKAGLVIAAVGNILRWVGGVNMATTFIGLAALMFGIMPISVYFPLFLFPTLLMLVMVFIIVVFYNIDNEMPMVKADLEQRHKETEGE